MSARDVDREYDAAKVFAALADIRKQVGLDGFVLGTITVLVTLCVAGDITLERLLETIRERYAVELADTGGKDD